MAKICVRQKVTGTLALERENFDQASITYDLTALSLFR
jgi:hypothetical protein